MTKLEIRAPNAPEDIAAIGTLCWEYRDFLLSLGGKDAEIVRLFYPENAYRALVSELEEKH